MAEKRRAIRKWAARIGGGLVAVTLLYVLSIGPVTWWFARHDMSNKQEMFLTTFYFPLAELGFWSPLVLDAVNWYCDLWR